MNVISISGAGGPEVLKLAERDVPVPQGNEVLIQVAAAGVNRPDIYQRKGNYPPPPGAPPDIPGLEAAGIVADTGPLVTRWMRGDRVCTLVSGGAYAEFLLAPEGQCLPAPPNLSLTEAASLPETHFTVWNNVFERGKLSAGEVLLVHGGSSGIGVAAIQLAVAAGASVWVTAGSDEKCKFCEELGASLAINYKRQPFKEVIRARSDKRAPDVILDMVGGSYTQDNLDVLCDDGRLVMINHMEGESVSIKLGTILRKRLVVTGSTLRARSEQFKSDLARAVETHVWPRIISGDVRPIVDRTFPLEEAADAHRFMEEGSHRGKIVLTVRG